jgi:hypothetical protein
MKIIPKETPYWILNLFGISQNNVDMLWLDAPRTLLFRTALGKANRHAMHNSKITIHHFHFDDMETLQHIL